MGGSLGGGGGGGGVAGFCIRVVWRLVAGRGRVVSRPVAPVTILRRRGGSVTPHGRVHKARGFRGASIQRPKSLSKDQRMKDLWFRHGRAAEGRGRILIDPDPRRQVAFEQEKSRGSSCAVGLHFCLSRQLVTPQQP